MIEFKQKCREMEWGELCIIPHCIMYSDYKYVENKDTCSNEPRH
jgi:hypothetical protein